MRVCFVAEGCYPYYVGGVSSWIDSMIRSFPNVEFVLLTIVSNRLLRGKFAYELPENVTEVYETYLEDMDWNHGRFKLSRRLNRKEFQNLRSLVLNRQCDWDTIFDLFQRKRLSVDELLMGEDFLKIITELYEKSYPEVVFSDFLWTMRSMYLPLFLVLRSQTPQADLYHCVATGYSGVLGCLAQHMHGGALIVSEHGIYTREREEEIIKATWIQNIYKNIWIEHFHRMSQLAYDRAQTVTSLFRRAQELQINLGCPVEKTCVTPNGIDTARLVGLPGKTKEDETFVNVGAVVRVAPIKDIKTMIQAFAEAKRRVPNLKLWIMGPTEEEKEYARECFELVELLGLKDVVFTGRVDVRDYLGRMDFMLLTRISEGQPLTILEGFAVGKPIIATDVGNCRGLIFGEMGDELGTAGILTHIMSVSELSQALIELAQNPAKVHRMGEVGRKRVMSRYRVEQMHEAYLDIYRSIAQQQGCAWTDEPFRCTCTGGWFGRG